MSVSRLEREDKLPSPRLASFIEQNDFQSLKSAMIILYIDFDSMASRVFIANKSASTPVWLALAAHVLGAELAMLSLLSPVLQNRTYIIGDI